MQTNKKHRKLYPMREEISYISLGEVDLYVEDTGPLSAPAVIVLHGIPRGSSRLLRQALSKHLENCRAIYFDQRGLGRSLDIPPDPDLYTIDALAEDVRGLTDALGLESFYLVGHGFGGVIALEVARRIHVEGAILLNPWLSPSWLLGQICYVLGCEEADKIDENVEQILKNKNFMDVFDQLIFSDTVPSQIPEELVAKRSKKDEVAIWGLLKSNSWKIDYRDYLKNPPATIKILVGEKDTISFPALKDAVDSSQNDIKIIRDAGHLLWIDHPKVFDGFINAFLSELTIGNGGLG